MIRKYMCLKYEPASEPLHIDQCGPADHLIDYRGLGVMKQDPEIQWNSLGVRVQGVIAMNAPFHTTSSHTGLFIKYRPIPAGRLIQYRGPGVMGPES